MKTQETTEAVLIVLATGGLFVASEELPREANLGLTLIACSLTLLVQGFIRDLWLLYKGKKTKSAAPKRFMRCMCLESTVGMTGIAIGGVLSLAFQNVSVDLAPLSWVMLAGAIMTFGLLTKDYIIQWGPLSLRKEENHHNIVFRFR